MEAESIEEYCRRVSPRLVGALALQCGDRLVAEELVQEALAKTWERWAVVSHMENPAGWTYRVAFNLARSRRRRAWAERRAHGRLPRSDFPAADAADRLTLVGALGALPPRQRAALVLRFYGQFTVAETATAMGCAPGTVKALTSQGVARLRGLLGDDVVDVAADVAVDVAADVAVDDG